MKTTNQNPPINRKTILRMEIRNQKILTRNLNLKRRTKATKKTERRTTKTNRSRLSLKESNTEPFSFLLALEVSAGLSSTTAIN